MGGWGNERSTTGRGESWKTSAKLGLTHPSFTLEPLDPNLIGKQGTLVARPPGEVPEGLALPSARQAQIFGLWPLGHPLPSANLDGAFGPPFAFGQPAGWGISFRRDRAKDPLEPSVRSEKESRSPTLRWLGQRKLVTVTYASFGQRKKPSSVRAKRCKDPLEPDQLISRLKAS